MYAPVLDLPVLVVLQQHRTYLTLDRVVVGAASSGLV